jgi:hypothetical protein
MKEMYLWVIQTEGGPQGTQPQQACVATEDPDWGQAVEKAKQIGKTIIAGPTPQGRVWV